MFFFWTYELLLLGAIHNFITYLTAAFTYPCFCCCCCGNDVFTATGLAILQRFYFFFVDFTRGERVADMPLLQEVIFEAYCVVVMKAT